MTTRRRPSPDERGGDDQYLDQPNHTPSRWGDPSRYDARKAPVAVAVIGGIILASFVTVHMLSGGSGSTLPAEQTSPSISTSPRESRPEESAFPTPADRAPRPTGDTQRGQVDRSDVMGPNLSDDSLSDADRVQASKPVNCLSTGDGVCPPEWKKARADVLGVLESHGLCLWLPKTKTNKLRYTWIVCEDGYSQVAD